MVATHESDFGLAITKKMANFVIEYNSGIIDNSFKMRRNFLIFMESPFRRYVRCVYLGCIKFLKIICFHLKQKKFCFS
ncbi:hypothetical protein AWH67_01290 [Bartonella bacilliformis]|nr:hypothetical protein AWH67_01290 [Bartonella bacilliformis]